MNERVESSKDAPPFHEHLKNILEGDVTDAEKVQLFEVGKTLASPGWKHISDMLELQRESIIKMMENTQDVGGQDGWRSLQGILKGFRLAVQIPNRLYARSVELMREQDDRNKEIPLQSQEDI